MITGDYDRREVIGDVMRVSVSSPVGAALIGRRPGEAVEIELPGGSSRQLEIVAVSRPAADGWD
jgi:transcription elongation GreA/GreB family factor